MSLYFFFIPFTGVTYSCGFLERCYVEELSNSQVQYVFDTWMDIWVEIFRLHIATQDDAHAKQFITSKDCYNQNMHHKKKILCSPPPHPQKKGKVEDLSRLLGTISSPGSVVKWEKSRCTTMYIICYIHMTGKEITNVHTHVPNLKMKEEPKLKWKWLSTGEDRIQGKECHIFLNFGTWKYFM